MIGTPSATEATTTRRIDGRWFMWMLAALAAVGLAIRVHVGSLEFMDFDEWQQVFMASAPRWTDLAYELNAEWHPPLFYLLLKGLLAFGHSKLLYRCIALVPGTGAIVLIGLIARRLLRSRAVALLCAAALAFSTAAITISVEVRQYQLAAFLVLIAFDAFLTLWTDDSPPRAHTCVVYAAGASMAVLCHYSAIVFVTASALLAAARQLLDSSWRWQRPWVLGLTLGAPLAVFLSLYVTYIQGLPPLGYLYAFYWRMTPGETLPGFLLRNFQNFWNLFAVVEGHSRAAFLTLASAAGVPSAAILWRSRRPHDPSILPILVAGVMMCELVALSIVRAYPFGGLLRHQYVVGPFLILGTFVVVDRAASLLNRRARAAMTAATAAVLIVNLAVRWPTLVVFPDLVMYTPQFNDYRNAFPNAQAVFVDAWGVIGYFIHTDDRPRHFVRRIDDVFPIDQYHIDMPDGGVELFYEKSRRTINVRYASLYRSLARCLKQSGVRQLTMFFFTPGDVPMADSPETLRQIITETADGQGLTVTRVVVGPTTIFAGFELKP
jgi:hypothetical protein